MCKKFQKSWPHGLWDYNVWRGKKSFFACARQGQQTLTARGAKFLNYATLSFCTIAMHIMLGTCVPNLRGRRWVEHTQMHPTLKKGTKHFHNTSKYCQFFFYFTFFETKIPTVDMKVHVYSKFRKNKIWKKVKSPISMRNRTFNTSKCRGKLQKMGVKFDKFFFKNGHKVWQGSGVDPRPAGDHWSQAGPSSTPDQTLCPFFWIFFPPALQILRMWSTLAGWLQHMPALAKPCPKTSNTHNFWFVGPKIMKFVLM
jgi:hypothetical protein